MIKSANDLMTSFRQFQLDDGKFSDLKISSPNSTHGFHVHRLVLSAASSLLYGILTDHDLYDEEQVTVIMPDLDSLKDVQDLVDFIYDGEVKVSHERMEHFLKLAKDLQITGLNSDEGDLQDGVTYELIDSVVACVVTDDNECSKEQLEPPPFQDLKFEEMVSDSVEDDAQQLSDVIASASLMRFTCPFKGCNKMFHIPDAVETHMSSEHKTKPKIVNVVTKSTTLQIDDSVQTTVLPYKCLFCEKSFATKTYLDHHVSLHCKHCGKKLVTPSKLIQHLASVHEKQKSFVCPTKGCEKTFKMKRYLIQHSKIHEKERGLTCDLCQKVLAGPRELRAHLRVHTGEKPYICRQCGISFRNRSTANTHMKVHSNKRSHVCQVCNHAFIQLGDLKKHMRSKHTNEKPFVCEWPLRDGNGGKVEYQCGKSFARSDYLLKHIRAHRKSNQQASVNNHQEVPVEEDVNTLLSEAMLHDDVGLASLESATESMDLVLPGSTTPQSHC